MVQGLKWALKQGWHWLILLGLLAYVWVNYIDRPIKQVVITHSSPNISLSQCRALMDPLIQSHWASLSLQELKDALKLGQWVGDVTLRRTWPYGLSVGLYERQALAQLDQETYVDQEGLIFHASLPKKRNVPLVQFLGPVDGVGEMKQFYQYMQQHCLLPESLQALEFHAGEVWHLFFDQSMQVVLSDQDKEKEWQHFCTSYTYINQRRSLKGKIVDLRDPDGVGIR